MSGPDERRAAEHTSEWLVNATGPQEKNRGPVVTTREDGDRPVIGTHRRQL